MSKRSYRPECLDCLEERALMSGAARRPHEPVALSRLTYMRFGEHVRTSFQIYGRDRGIEDLRERLRDESTVLPFARVDGLGLAVNRIVDRMEEALAAEEPLAVRAAANEVLATARDLLRARVVAGDVVVR
jgi:hypothetical protein